MWRRRSYLVELETVKDENYSVHHLVCEVNGKLELSEIIKNLDVDEWRLISATEIDPYDAQKLSDILDGKDPDEPSK